MFTIEIQVRDEKGEVVGTPVELARKHSQLTAMEFVMSIVDASSQVEYWCMPTTPESQYRMFLALTKLPVGVRFRLAPNSEVPVLVEASLLPGNQSSC